MFIQILVASLLGLLAGVITGLIPGIHVNFISLLLFTSSAFLLQFTTPIVLASFIASMAITHTVIDFIPSIFFGAPEASTALSVLPGHSLLLEGKGYAAVKLTVIGSFGALLLLLVIAPIFIFGLPKIYPFIKQYMAFILIATSCFLIWEERRSRFWAFILFSLSGILGIASLNLAILNQPLFPLLSY